MKIIVAKYAGFCEGVRRAVGMALDLAQKSPKPLYTCGELIHNPQVISLLRRKSILDVKNIDEARNGSLLIRSHGIAPSRREEAQNAGIPVVDATCPHVLRIHSIIKKAASDGASTIIVGDAGHAEVEGLLGCAAGRGHVVGSVEEVDSLAQLEGPVCVVAQTTQDEEAFEKIAQHIRQKLSAGQCSQNHMLLDPPAAGGGAAARIPGRCCGRGWRQKFRQHRPPRPDSLRDGSPPPTM